MLLCNLCLDLGFEFGSLAISWNEGSVSCFSSRLHWSVCTANWRCPHSIFIMRTKSKLHLLQLIRLHMFYQSTRTSHFCQSTHDRCKCHFNTHTSRGVAVGCSPPFEPREVHHVLYRGEWLRLNIKVYISITTSELTDSEWYNGNQPIM